MSLIYCYKNRGITKDFTIKDADGETITPGGTDHVRVTIGRAGETAKLTVISEAATANGSSFTKGSTCRLRLDAADLDFAVGTYTLQLDYYDSADAAEWKMVEKQVMVLEDV